MLQIQFYQYYFFFKLGLSTVRIESQSLERLLEAMDARHVAGWYQPGMRLLARINNLEGVNSNLRHQLHSLQ